jgi:hypothetical protein
VKRRLFPLFLGNPLLGSCPTCPSRRGRSSGLGDTARLCLAQDLGLLNDSRSGNGSLAGLARVGLGLSSSLGGSLLGSSLGSSLLVAGSLSSLLGSSLLGGGFGGLGSLSSGLSSRLRGRLGRGLSRGLDTRLLLSELHGARGTLRLREVALLHTSLDGLVELGIKGRLGGDVDLVVALNIFLQRLTAASVALFEIDDGILDHISVGAVSGGSGSRLLSRCRGSGSFLGRHFCSFWNK